MSRAISRRPVRVGLTPTSRAVTREPSTRFAATSTNAAADTSPGMAISNAGMRRSHPVGSISTTGPTARSGTPSACSIRSVWSRETEGSRTRVTPSAYRPDRRMALLTCALATGLSYSSAESARPSSRGPMTRGARMSCFVGCLRPSMTAPRCRSGAATRIIGRRCSVSSPTRVDRKCAAASTPQSRRIVVPELPQSRSAAGACRPRSPLPCTTSSVGDGSSMTMPIARRALAVETLSSPCENPVMRVSPSQSAPSSSDRCPMLLSDGTGTLPVSGPVAGCTTRVVTAAPGWRGAPSRAASAASCRPRRTCTACPNLSSPRPRSCTDMPPMSGPSKLSIVPSDFTPSAAAEAWSPVG